MTGVPRQTSTYTPETSRSGHSRDVRITAAIKPSTTPKDCAATEIRIVRSNATANEWSGWKTRDQRTCQSTAASTVSLLPERECAQAPLRQDRRHRPARV